MATPKDVLYFAERYIGVEENPPKSNRTLFGEWYGWNGVAWCAIFVSYCFYRARMTLPYEIQSNRKGFAYCPYGVNYFRSKGKLDKTPKVGDIVFFDWQQDGVSDHVGIVEKVLSNERFISIEGNTSYRNDSNGGQVMRRQRHVSTILGFAHPDYDGVSLNLSLDNPSWPGYYITLTSPVQRGPDIQEWQEQMISIGYDLGPAGADGVFGEKSSQALEKFQKDKRLEVDGVIGPISWDETWAAAIGD
jgi:hypothetical protein